MMKRLILLFLLCLMAAPTWAQTTTPTPVFPLKPGTVEGNINDSAPSVRYSFDANAGDSVTISMDATSGDLDPYLQLFGPDNRLVDRNDDRESGNRNALIALTLTQAGTYVIQATRFDQTGTTTSGTFRLTLTIAGTQSTDQPADPLSVPPSFGVDFSIIDFQAVVSGSLTDGAPLKYYAIGGKQGDLVRVIMTRTNGDLSPHLRLLNERAEEISRESPANAGELIAYVTLPQTGWYLIEAGRTSGTGTFDLYATRIAAAALTVGQPVTAAFTPETPTLSYLMDARIGDLISVTMFTSDTSTNLQPQLELLDLSLTTIARATGDRFVTLRATVPRSGLYLVRASTLRANSAGGFNLRLTSTPGMLPTPTLVSYNNQYKGTITDYKPLDFYHFSGKTGELVTISMSAANSALNAYLILMDSDLNELASNDDVTTSPDARITQFRLPKDGDYLILATRSGLADGTTTGAYDLAITAGEIALTTGAFTATLKWDGSADLNLFVRDPNGRTVSWSSPKIPDGGTLQIDSNTNCETPSDQPIEHSYWPTLIPGDYQIWAWYQNGCGHNISTAFTLTVKVNSVTAFSAQDRLRPSQRYEADLRVADDGTAYVINPGAIANPSAQQIASEGGDIVIRYGDALTGTLDDQVYARFYQFSGTAGDQVEIRLERVTGDLDPIVVLRDSGDHTLLTNDDADPSTKDSRLTYTLPATDTYIIAATRFGIRDGTTSGDYRLTLTKLGS